VVDRHAKEMRWYLNGSPNGKGSIPATMTKGLRAAGRDITIPSAYQPFRGLIGDLRIYGQALSAERVRELFQEEAPRRASTEIQNRD
jgi:hypothetical protein